jgi:hypothetical protein
LTATALVVGVVAFVARPGGSDEPPAAASTSVTTRRSLDVTSSPTTSTSQTPTPDPKPVPSSTPSPSTPTLTYCVTDTTPLNLRAGPGTDFAAQIAIPIDRCDLTDAGTTPELEGEWRHVRWQGVAGWVHVSRICGPVSAGGRCS